MADSDDDRVYITHPEVGGTAVLGGPVPRSSLPFWQDRGWEEHDAALALEDQTVDQLRALAEQHDVDLSGRRSKAQIVEALSAAGVGAPVEEV